jgi:glycosyltransferase involved in cell wall biosynthesis
MALKVGLVARCLNTEHIRGMGKYVFDLLQQSSPEHGLEWHLFGDDHRHGMVAPAGKPLSSDIFIFKGDRFHLWEQLGLPLRAIKRDIDVLHCTEGTLSLWQPKPTVVTVHDTLSWEEHDDTPMATAYYETILPAAMKKSAAIITISESSKLDILTRWPWLEHKLNVIPHGIEGDYFTPESGEIPDELQTQIGDAAYIVYLGGPMERKRFNWALEVLARTEHRSLHLVVCGFGSAARRVAVDKLPTNLQDRVHFANFLSDCELRALYRGAKAVLYPTLYEGFGFPAVEAQAAGVPVIFSALGSLKELIGPLALVVPPDDMEAWLAAVSEAMNMGERRADRARAASQWAKKFSWKESFEKHLVVYRQAALVKQ